MRIFKKFPDQDKCFICGTNKEGSCCLVGIDGTEEGHNILARAVHTDCLELRYTHNKEMGFEIIYQIKR